MTAQPERPPGTTEPAVWIRLPLGRPFTQGDLDELPELPGLQVELVDGMLLVNPSPHLSHQRMSVRLYGQLRAACPPGLEVFFPRFDVKPVDERTLEPDLLVGATEDFMEHFIARPLLVVEVRSPSTRLKDETLKRAAYEQAGIASYWLVDPLEPAMTVLELTSGRYREVAQVSGDDAYEAQRPYPIRIALR